MEEKEEGRRREENREFLCALIFSIHSEWIIFFGIFKAV